MEKAELHEKAFLTVQVPVELAQYVMLERSYCGQHIKNRNDSSCKYFNRYKDKVDKGNFTHTLTKILGMYLLLKAESGESGWIKDYTSQVHVLSVKFGFSQRSFFTYMKELERMKLAFREAGKIRIVGWDQMGKLLDIDTKERHKINFYNDGKQKMHWWFAAIEIKCNQERQAYMIWKKVNKNSEVKNDLMMALTKRGFDTTKADDPEYLSEQLLMLSIEDFRTGTEVHDILVMIRSDVNRSCKKLGNDWIISPQLVSYWKQQMGRQKIINVTKLRIQSEWTKATKECHKRKGNWVIWNDKLKERVWFLCDQITLLMPWKWEDFLAKKLAA